MKRRSVFSLLCVAFSCFTVGCSSNTSDSTSATTSESEETFTFTVGMEANYPPFNWTENTQTDENVLIKGKTNEYAAGYDVKIAQFVAQDNNWNLEIVALEWDSLIPSVNSDIISAVCAGMSYTDERAESATFTDEYINSTLVLITRKNDSRFSSETNFDFQNELTGVKLITQANTFEDDLASEWATNFGATHLNPLNTYPDAFYQVSQGNADAVICEMPVAKSTIGSMTDLQITPFDNSLIDEKYRMQTKICMALKKDDPHNLQEKINASLSKITEEQRNTWMDEAIEDSKDI